MQFMKFTGKSRQSKAEQRKKECKKVEKMIPQFIRDELDDSTKKHFLEHIEECSSCKEELSIQYLVMAGMASLEKGEAFDLNRALSERIELEWKHLHTKRSLQNGLYAVEAGAMLAAALILSLFVVV